MKCAKKTVARGKNRSKLRARRGAKAMEPDYTKSYINGLKLNPQGIYIYRIMVSGKVRTGTTGCTRLFEAERYLTDKRSEHQKESLGTLKIKAPTFAQGVEIWVKDKTGYVTDQYITNGKNLLNLHFVPLIGTIFVDKVDKVALKTCLQSYLAKTQAGKETKNFGGYNQLLTILHSFFNVMEDNHYISTQYNLYPKYEQQQKKVKRYIKEDKIDSYLDFIDTHYEINKSVGVRMGIWLGLRSIEVVKAKWGMIDWQTNYMRNWDTKGKECEPIPICDEMLEWFLKLKESRGKVKPTDYIIQNTSGEQALRAFTRYPMQIAGREVLEQPLSSHDMRRTFIMTLYKNKVDIEVIQKLARHKNIKTTLEYIMTNQEDKVTAINDVFNKRKNA